MSLHRVDLLLPDRHRVSLPINAPSNFPRHIRSSSISPKAFPHRPYLFKSPDTRSNPAVLIRFDPFTMSATHPGKSPLQVGVLLCGEGVQLLDISPVDVLGMLEPYYIRACQLPQSFIDMGVEMKFHFITETGEGTQQLTGGMKCVVTVGHNTLMILWQLLLPSTSVKTSNAVD